MLLQRPSERGNAHNARPNDTHRSRTHAARAPIAPAVRAERLCQTGEVRKRVREQDEGDVDACAHPQERDCATQRARVLR